MLGYIWLIPNWIWHAYVHIVYICTYIRCIVVGKRGAHTLQSEGHSQFSIRKLFCGFFRSTHPLYYTIYGLRVHGTVLSVSLVHCLFQGKNLCAAGEHELHTGWIMNKRTTCRRTGTLRIRHEVRGAANGNTWKGLTGRGGGWAAPPCNVMWSIALSCLANIVISFGFASHCLWGTRRLSDARY